MPAPPDGAASGAQAATPLDQAIRSSVETQLAALGYEQLHGETEPDFWVAYHLATPDELNAETIYRGSPVPYSGVYPTETYVPEYDVGTLLLDVIRAQPRALIWRGWARSAVRGGRSVDTERVRSALSRIFERFPARASGALSRAG